MVWLPDGDKILKMYLFISKSATTVLKLGGPSAVGASRVEAPKAPKRVRVGRGCPLSTGGMAWGGGRAPSPEIFLIFFI